MSTLTPVGAGDLATIVTTLEMTAPPVPSPSPTSPLRLDHWPRPDPARYRALFRRVGAPWLWYSRLVMPTDRLLAIIHDPAVEIFAVVRTNEPVGMLELDFREPGQCELAYVGLVPAETGQRHGHWLMAEALRRAWRAGIERAWVHTCTLDHPAALDFYRKSGFVPIRRTIETFPDPRAIGVLPPDSAPQIPLLATKTR